MAYTHSRYKAAPAVHAVQVETPKAEAAIDVDHNDSPDEASAAFKRQIDALRRSEQIQGERLARGGQVQQQFPSTREGRMLAWRNQGFSDDQAHHLNRMHENPDLTARAYQAAKTSGMPEDSQAFHDLVSVHYDKIAGDTTVPRMKDPLTASPDATEFTEDPAPAPKRKRGGAVDDDLSRPTRFMSAPVSRDGGTMALGGSYGRDRPGTVTLTPAMKEAAAIAGISLREYAEQVLELRKRKADGDYGGQV